MPTTQVPGPPGHDGTNGTNGTPGANSFTVTTASFVMPAVSGSVVVAVLASGWAVVGQVAYCQSAGYFSVSAKTDATHVTLVNLGYAGNAAPTTVVATAQALGPAGLIGPTGPAGTNATPSPTQQKGDLIVDNGASAPSPSDVRLPVGANGTRLVAASGQPTGLQWAAVNLASSAEVANILAISNGGTGAAAIPAAFDNLAPATPVRGDIIAYDGTHWVRRPRGTQTQVLTTNFFGDAVWTDRGRVLQETIMVTAATSTFTAATDFDDTIPQIGQGALLFTNAWTPKDPLQSYVEVDVLINVCCKVVDQIIAHLHANGAASAVAVSSTYQFIANQPNQIRLLYQNAAVVGTPITFTLRLGTAGGNPLHVNAIDDGAGNALRKFGGAQLSCIRITEFSLPG